MRQAYKLEIFDRSIDFRSFSVIEPQAVFFDYLTLEKTKITSPIIAVEKGDFAHITNTSGDLIYQGVVADIEVKKATLDISLVPLLSLFDVSIYYDISSLSGALESFIGGMITAQYISNADSDQAIPMTLQTLPSVIGAKLNLESNINNIYDVILSALQMYGVVVSPVLYPQQKRIVVTIRKPDVSEYTIEADLKNVLEKNIVIGDSYGQLNKIVLINENDESEQIVYYLHTNGTVDTDNTYRVLPVFSTTEYIQSDSFSVDAEKRAIEALTPQAYNNLIELTFSKTDRLIDAENMSIGAATQIIRGDQIYSSILTGYEKDQQTIKLIFGNVRVDLTKKLIIDRRKNR